VELVGNRERGERREEAKRADVIKQDIESIDELSA